MTTGTIERLVDERACEQILYRYFKYIDFGEADRAASLFTENGIWKLGTAELVGQAKIERAFTRRKSMTDRVSRHVCTNFQVSASDAEHIAAHAYLVVYRYDANASDADPRQFATPAIVGEINVQFTSDTAAGWKINSFVVDSPTGLGA